MPEPGPPELRAERTTETGGLSWFLAGAASWFTGYGMQGVLFSTLLVVELGEGPARVGAAQSALMVPAVVLILLGGAVADRVDRRRLLIALHVAAAGIVLTLCAVLANGGLGYGVLIAYALAIGTVQAFVMPARDSLLSEVAGGNLGRGVAALNLIQWGTQAAGAFLASSARLLGAVPMLAIQADRAAGHIPAGSWRWRSQGFGPNNRRLCPGS